MQPEAAIASCIAGVSVKGKRRTVRVGTFCPINTVKITFTSLHFRINRCFSSVQKLGTEYFRVYSFAIVNDIQIGKILVVGKFGD